MSNSQGQLPRKDPAIAVLLNFLWTGAGHVYAGSTNTGIVLIIISLIIFMLGLASGGIACCVGFPFWVWGMFAANSAAKAYNRSNGWSQ